MTSHGLKYTKFNTGKLAKHVTIDADADVNTLDTQLRLALADAMMLHDHDDRGSWECLFAHFQRVFEEFLTVDNLLAELVRRAGTHDGVNDDDLDMTKLLTGVEVIADNIAYWSKIDTSYTPEVAAANDISNALEAYRKAKQ